jgi:hypothetical protein
MPKNSRQAVQMRKKTYTDFHLKSVLLYRLRQPSMGIVENLKDVLKLADAANNLDLYKKLAELQTSILALQDENRELKDRVGQLNQQLSLKDKMHFTAPFYYQENDKTPYCPACWEGKNAAIHVLFVFDREDIARWDCPTCKYEYLIEKHSGRDDQVSYSSGEGPTGEHGWMAR